MATIVSGPMGAALRVCSGSMKVAAGQKLVVSIGDKTQTLTAAKDGVLTVEVKAGTETQVTLWP